MKLLFPHFVPETATHTTIGYTILVRQLIEWLTSIVVPMSDRFVPYAHPKKRKEKKRKRCQRRRAAEACQADADGDAGSTHSTAPSPSVAGLGSCGGSSPGRGAPSPFPYRAMVVLKSSPGQGPSHATVNLNHLRVFGPGKIPRRYPSFAESFIALWVEAMVGRSIRPWRVVESIGE